MRNALIIITLLIATHAHAGTPIPGGGGAGGGVDPHTHDGAQIDDGTVQVQELDATATPGAGEFLRTNPGDANEFDARSTTEVLSDIGAAAAAHAHTHGDISGTLPLSELPTCSEGFIFQTVGGIPACVEFIPDGSVTVQKIAPDVGSPPSLGEYLRVDPANVTQLQSRSAAEMRDDVAAPPQCTLATLHGATCAGAITESGRKAVVTNADATELDSCAIGAATGTDEVECHYIDGAWSEIGGGSGGGVDAHTHSGADINAGTVPVTALDALATPGVGEFIRTNPADAAQFDSRTSAEVLSDIGAAAASHPHTQAEVTGTVSLSELPTCSEGFYFQTVGGVPACVQVGGDDLEAGTVPVTALDVNGTASVSDYLRVDASNAARLQVRTPTQVRGDIGAAPTSHNHSGADVTTGTVARARLQVCGEGEVYRTESGVLTCTDDGVQPPTCLVSQLQASTCPGAVESAGRLAVVSDGNEDDRDKCDDGATGGGGLSVLCHYISGEWKQVVQDSGTDTVAVAGARALTPEDCNGGRTRWANAPSQDAAFTLHAAADSPGSLCAFEGNFGGTYTLNPQPTDIITDAALVAGSGMECDFAARVQLRANASFNWWAPESPTVGWCDTSQGNELPLTANTTLAHGQCGTDVITNEGDTDGVVVTLPDIVNFQYSSNRHCAFKVVASQVMTIKPADGQTIVFANTGYGQSIESGTALDEIRLAPDFKSNKRWIVIDQVGTGWSADADTLVEYDAANVPNDFITNVDQIGITGTVGQTLVVDGSGDWQVGAPGAAPVGSVFGRTGAIDIVSETNAITDPDGDPLEEWVVIAEDRLNPGSFAVILTEDFTSTGQNNTIACTAGTGVCIVDTGTGVAHTVKPIRGAGNIAVSSDANGMIIDGSAITGIGDVVAPASTPEFYLPVWSGTADTLANTAITIEGSIIKIPAGGGIDADAPVVAVNGFGSHTLVGKELFANGGHGVFETVPTALDASITDDVVWERDAFGRIKSEQLLKDDLCQTDGTGCPAGVTLPRFTECVAVATKSTTLLNTDDFAEAYRNIGAAYTISTVSCDSDQEAATAQLVRDDEVTPANVHGAPIPCDGTALSATGAVDVGNNDSLDLLLVGGHGATTRVTVCWGYDFD